jgi:hypothetical protein
MLTYDIHVLMGNEIAESMATIKCHDTGANLRIYPEILKKISKWRTITQPYTIPAGSTAILKVTKSDKNYVLTDAKEVTNDNIYFEPHPQTFTAVGKAEAEVNIYGPDMRRITSGTFYLDISKECTDNCTEDSQIFIDVLATQIQSAIDAAERSEEAATRAEKAASAEQTATEKVEALEKSVQEAAEKVEDLEGSVQETATKAEALEKSVQETTEKVDDLESRTQEATDKVDTMENSVQEAAEKVEALEGSVQETAEKAEALEKSVQEAAASVKRETVSGYYRATASGSIVHMHSEPEIFTSTIIIVANNGGATVRVVTNNTNSAAVLVTDKDFNVLRSYAAASGNPALVSEYDNIVLPDDAYYLFIPCYTGYEPTVSGLDVATELNTIHAIVSDTKEQVEALEGGVQDATGVVGIITVGTDNLLNPLTATKGYLTDAGNIRDSDSFFTSDFINVAKDETIRVTRDVIGAAFYALCFYDANKKFLSIVTDGSSAVAPENAAFVRVSFLAIPDVATISKYMVYKGEAKEFVTYRAIKPGALPKDKSPYPDVEIVLPRKLVVADGVSVSINHQSVVKNWDVTRAVSANIMGNPYPTYGHKSVITGGKRADGTINFLFTPDYNIGLLQKRMDVVNVAADAGAGQTKKVLFIGDSKTDANEYTQYLLNMFESDEMSVELLGTRGDTAQNRHEGRSGWSAEFYVENNASRGVKDENGKFPDSPFFNPETKKFDFSYYMTQNGYTGVDYVFINLGTNDTVDNFIGYYHDMIDGIRAYNKNIVIGLWIPAPFATFGGYTHATNDNQTFAAMKAVIDEFDTAEYEADRVFVVPIHMNIDTFHDFPWTEVRYNDKTEDTYRVCTDQIHEVNGYKHNADVIFGYIKYFATLGGGS